MFARILAGLVLAVLLTPTAAEARCGRSSWHSLHSLRGWSASCYACHKPAGYSGTGLLADIAAMAREQKRYESQVLARQQEFQQAVALIGELGLQGNSQARAYGLAQAYGYSASAGYGGSSYAEQGSSVYGYSAVAQPYGTVDVAALFAMADRQTSNAQQLAGSAQTGFMAAVSETGQAARDVAQTQAIGQAAAAIVQSLKSEPTTFSRTFQFEVNRGDDGQIRFQPLAVLSGKQVIESKCLACHSGDMPKGGINLTGVDTFGAEQWAAVLSSVTNADPAKRMPKGPDGKPGAPLSAAEIQAFVQEWERARSSQ